MKEAHLEEKTAKKIARKVERALEKLNYTETTGSLIRSLAVDSLRYFELDEAVRAYAPLTIALHDAQAMDIGASDSDNANQLGSPETSHKAKADIIAKKQALRTMPQDLATKHRTGDFHVHDLDYWSTRPFCRSHDVRYFYRYGFVPDGTGAGSSAAAAPQHATVAILQAVKVLAMAQTQYSGGQGLLHFLTFISPYLEGMTYKEIKQQMQMMVFELNQVYVSRGGQAVFSSVNMTPGVPLLFKDAPAVYKGEVSSRTYGEFEREVRLAFKALIEVLGEGDAYGRTHPFPKAEICLQKEFMDEFWDEPMVKNGEIIESYKQLYEMAFDLAAKTGAPYFDNLLAAYRKDDGKSIQCYQCCAYQFSSDETIDEDFQRKISFEAGKGFDLGGMQAVSLNLPRCAYKADHDDAKLWTEIRELMEAGAKVFLEKRKVIKRIEHRLTFALQTPIDHKTGKHAPCYTDLDSQVYEFGVVGLADMVEYHTGRKTVDSEEAREFAREILSYMGMVANGISHKYGIKAVVARTPAETTAQRFAVLDLLQGYDTNVIHGDVAYAKEHMNDTGDLPVYYSNGIGAAFGENATIYQRIKAENDLWAIMTGGSILHVFLGEQETDGKALMSFALNMARKTSIGYFSFTKDMTVCQDCKQTSSGLQTACSKCGSENVETYSRITGYLSPTSRWNKGKAQELKDRKRYQV